MKRLSLKILGAVACSLLATTSFSQGNNWRINGNNNTTSGTNFLGTTNNQALDIRTNGIQRIHLNEDRTQNINGVNVTSNGFMGLGPNSPGLGHPSGLWSDLGPFSLLHLNGVTAPGDFVFSGGFRNWMRTGITLTDQIDMAYIGLRS
ncbi:MAG: hypothetical protein QMB65_08260, partial [Vicingaceae bacterium]